MVSFMWNIYNIYNMNPSRNNKFDNFAFTNLLIKYCTFTQKFKFPCIQKTERNVDLRKWKYFYLIH